MKTSLIIPCYNEAKNLPLLISRCQEFVEDLKNIEIVIVDNGSIDNTSSILKILIANLSYIKVVRIENNQGYGHGILTGLNAATGDILSWTHADMQTDPADLLKGMKLFEATAHPEQLFVKGKRRNRPIADALFTIGMALFETLLLRKVMWDINAQPTMFHRNFFSSWNNPPDDFLLDLYAYYMAKNEGLVIQRFPVLFGDRAHGISHWNVSFASKYKFIKRTLSYSFGLHHKVK